MKRTVIEGEEEISMQIICSTLKDCVHEKISWYVKNEEIPFDPRDSHFRRESIHNIHRLWIDKAFLSDAGTYAVRNQKDEKQCELEVLGNGSITNNANSSNHIFD